MRIPVVLPVALVGETPERLILARFCYSVRRGLTGRCENRTTPRPTPTAAPLCALSAYDSPGPQRQITSYADPPRGDHPPATTLQPAPYSLPKGMQARSEAPAGVADIRAPP